MSWLGPDRTLRTRYLDAPSSTPASRELLSELGRLERQLESRALTVRAEGARAIGFAHTDAQNRAAAAESLLSMVQALAADVRAGRLR
jgi:hypothetical protein